MTRRRSESGRVQRWSWWSGRTRRHRFGNPHSVRLGRDQFGDGVCQCGERCDVEDGEGIFAFEHAARG